MKTRRQILQLAIAGAGVAGTAAFRTARAQSWAGNAADEQAIDRLYSAAAGAGESELVIYGAYTSIFRPIWDLFSKRFAKIAIVGNPVNGAQLAAKLDAEYASGQHAADIVTSGLTELMAAVDQKRAMVYTPPNIASLPARYRDAQGRFVINYAELFGVVYNIEKMKSADVPRSPADLLQPRYKGMLIDEPGSSRVSDLVWIELLASGKIDAAWIKAMKAQTTVVPSLTPFFNQLTTGTINMIAWGGHARYLGLKQAGAPVAFSATPGLAVPVLAGTVVLNKAPHPNAARLFQAWFLSTEAQNAIVTLGNSYGLTPSVQLPNNEADWPKLGPISEALKAVSPEQYMEAKSTLARVVEANFK